ncbi:MAG: AtpZ/AtpI family protein [Planctomycetaceae bacterium]|nr:AtpZ/AtpI family protein [Planctomycetaceae bacterium]
MPKSHDEIPPLVAALQWATRITTIAAEMAAPGLIGYLLDRRLGTGLVLLTLGTALGFLVGILSLVKLLQHPPDKRNDDD